MPAPKLVLASRSPRRSQMLRELGVDFEVRTGPCEERWREGESPVAFAKRTATEKLQACPRERGELRLAADTVVWIDGQPAPLGKPRDRARAREMLEQLQSAGEHTVTTAFALDGGPKGDEAVTCVAVSTRVTFRTLNPGELEHYLDGGEWSDKAGGYGIQAGAASFIPRIEGSYTNVVGLPLAEVVEHLGRLGLLTFDRTPRS